MQRGGAATCRIVDSHHQYSSDLPQGGLQIPCQLVFQSEDTELIEKIKKIVKSAPPIDLKPAKTMPKRKLESRLELSHEAMVEPVKKNDRVSDNPAIDLSTGPSARDTVKEIPWVKFGRQILTTADKDIILGGELLTDKHINFAQKLVGYKFKNIYGLQLTLTLHKATRVPAKCAKNFLQIMHCRNSHWIVASTILSYPKVTVYDSLYNSIDRNTTGILKQLFGPKVEVVINNDIKQIGVEDCGLFAIANCLCLAEDRSPPRKFDQAKMRQHLVDCIENLNLTMFPCISAHS